MNSAPRLLILPFLATLLPHRHNHRADAQPTLNREALPEHGPNDRFTEGTSIETLFKEIDLNGDMKLDRHEVDLYFQKKGAPVSDGLWENEDRNGDGVIEYHEFVRGSGDEL